jgi:DNA-binding transcriptional MerR regulator
MFTLFSVKKMIFNDIRDWKGTAEDLLEELQRKIKQLNLSVESPTVRTLRAWRSKKLLSQPKGEKFCFRQILEGLTTLLLLKKGWTLVSIAQVLSSWNDKELEQQILVGVDETESIHSQESFTLFEPKKQNNVALAEDSIVLLAQGILRQYDCVLTGTKIVRQDDKLPSELHSAMCKLGRLYLEEGKCDGAACVHDLLSRSRYSLNRTEHWDLGIFRDSEFPFANVQLIDTDLRVPTPDCAEIAEISGGYGENNVIENRLHTIIRTATERLGKRKQHQAYTALRQLLGRRSLIQEKELVNYLVEKNLTPLQETVLEFYDPVPEVWLINDLANRCAYCGTLMRPHPKRANYPDGCCPIHQCNSKYAPKVSERLDPEKEGLLIAKPQILAYWTAPAIDELAIFDQAQSVGLDTELYPESDRCDVAINDLAIGIDAKSYRSPVLLASKLNRSIGGLIFYRQRIVAITDELINDCPGYLSTLHSLLDKKSDTASLEIMPVSSVIKNIQEGKYAS